MIKLTPISEKHRDSFVVLLNNPNVEKWLLQVPSPYTYEDADSFINKCLNEKNDRDVFSYAIENDGVHVGGMGLNKKHEHSAEVGYWIGEEFWGNGFASIALNKVLEIAFNELKFSRVFAHVFTGNVASEVLLLKCGFEYEGFLKKCHKKGEVFIDSKLFAKVV